MVQLEGGSEASCACSMLNQMGITKGKTILDFSAIVVASTVQVKRQTGEERAAGSEHVR
jgi:hypothetical protein